MRRARVGFPRRERSIGRAGTRGPAGLSMPGVKLTTQAYCKMVLHGAKYPHCAVNGLLVAEKQKPRKEHLPLGGPGAHHTLFVDCIPLFHGTLALAPMLEVALTLVSGGGGGGRSPRCTGSAAADALRGAGGGRPRRVPRTRGLRASRPPAPVSGLWLCRASWLVRRGADTVVPGPSGGRRGRRPSPGPCDPAADLATLRAWVQIRQLGAPSGARTQPLEVKSPTPLDCTPRGLKRWRLPVTLPRPFRDLLATALGCLLERPLSRGGGGR